MELKHLKSMINIMKRLTLMSQLLLIFMQCAPFIARGQDTLSMDQRIFIMERRTTFMESKIDILGYDFRQPDVNKALYAASLAEKKRDGRNGWGVALIGTGVLTGLLAIATERSFNGISSALGAPESSTHGASFLIPAAVGIGLSIPCFIAAGKQKREMERHLDEVRRIWTP